MRVHAAAHVVHGLGLLDGEIDQRRAEQIERGEEIEIGGEPEMVGDAGGDQPPDQIAGDVAGDIGGEGASRIGGGIVLAEIGQRQREGRRHAQSLRYAQQREGGEVRRMREQRGRDGEEDEADQDALPAIDLAAEIADGQAGKGHAQGAGIDGKAHLRRRHAVMLGERGKDGLRGEEIDDGEEGGQGDDDIAERGPRGMMRLGIRSGDGVRRIVHGACSSRRKGCDALLGEKGVTSEGGGSFTSCGRSDPSAGRRRATPRSCRPDSSTNAKCPWSRRRHRRPCAGSARRSCWHIR